MGVPGKVALSAHARRALARPAVAATTEALRDVFTAVSHAVVDLIVGAGQVVHQVPGVGIGETSNPGQQQVDGVVAVEQIESIPGAVHIPGCAEAQCAIGIEPPGNAGSRIVGIVLGDQVLAGKLLAQALHDELDRVGLNGLHRVEAQPVDLIVAQVHARIVEQEVLDLLLPEGEALTPGSVVAMNVVDAALNAVVTRTVAVVLPVAVVGARGVVVDHVQNHGQATRMSSVDELDQLHDRLVGCACVEILGGEHVAGTVAFVRAIQVAAEIADGQC